MAERTGKAAGGDRMATEYAAADGNQKVEFLDLAWPQIDRAAGHMRVKRAKQRGKKRGEVIEQIEITPLISALLDRMTDVRKDHCLYVFSNRSGNAHTQAWFKAMWQKLMLQAMEEKVIAHRFTFYDLRTYYVTQHKAERGVLPDLHANPATTARVYDRSRIVKRKAL